MKIETLEIAGFVSAFKALRLSYGKEERSIGAAVTTLQPDKDVIMTSSYLEPHPEDMKLLSTLVKRGDEHAKVARGIIVYARITMPIYVWVELETYRAGHERLMSESTMHVDCKGLSGEELQKAKAEIPMGKELTKVDFFSYQCLRNIYKQRHNHRLQEWHQFCDWIRNLPFAEELILNGLEDE